MTIRRALPDEIDAAAALARESFMIAVAPSYSAQGARTFLDFAATDALRKRLEENCTLYVAFDGDTLLGMAVLKDFGHISMLFVAPSAQRKGVGRKLVAAAVSAATKSVVTVNSSPNAVGAYERFGFRRTADERVDDGLRLVPMALEKTPNASDGMGPDSC